MTFNFWIVNISFQYCTLRSSDCCLWDYLAYVTGSWQSLVSATGSTGIVLLGQKHLVLLLSSQEQS